MVTKASVSISMSFIAAAFLAFAAPAEAASVVAKKDNVPVLAQPSNGAKVITTLKKDQGVDAVERKGMFWEVKVNGQTGYVPVVAVNRKAEEAQTSLAKAIRAAAQDGREADDSSSSRARSSVMGVRGLGESDQTAGAGNVTPNLRMVYQMEDRQVSQKRLDALAKSVNGEIEKKMARSK